MARFVLRRFLISIVLLVVASFLCFLLVQALGDPIAEWAAGQRQRNPNGADAAIAAAYQRAGLDQPLLTRYWQWLTGFVGGDWGTTVNPGQTAQEVEPKVMHSLWITIRLVLGAELLAIALGAVVGVISAVKRYSWFDYVLTAFSFLMFALPLFCVAVLLKIGGINFNNFLQANGMDRWLVTSGYPPGGFTGSFWNQAYQYIGVYLLPTLTLMAISFALYARYQRSSMLDVLGSDYIRTAYAKGLTNQRVIWKHAFRNALIPLVTVGSLQVGAVFAGAIITETVFGWQGMGYILVQNVNRKEPYMILAWMMVVAVFVILFNLIADIAYTLLDPRIRLD
ncbi:ABC transporter permease [Nakamurella sp.]|uniref:ABC transporter permease n=1 Tax=Nakamurella sp. TaxID=1869182 RepID=UPI0037841699